jgi:hypothetical protein
VKSKNIKDLLTINPFVSFTYAEIILQFVTYKGCEKVVDFNPVLFVFTKNGRKIEDFVKLVYIQDCSDRKAYILVRNNLICS